MTRRAWGFLLAALVIIAAVLAFNVAPAAGADEDLTPDVTVSRYTNVPRLLPTR